MLELQENGESMIFDSIELCIPRYYQSREKLFKNLMGKRIIDALLHMRL